MGDSPAATQPSDAGRLRMLVACLLFLVAFEMVALTVRGPGMTYDEGHYISGAMVHTEWVRRIGRDAMDPAVLESLWAVNHEHPPLSKYVMMVGGLVWGARGPLFAMRTSMGLVFGALIALVYLFVARRWSDRAGLYAAFTLIFMPRVLGEAHLAALEVSTALAWLATTAVYARAVERGGPRACLLTGFVYGLALLTRLSTIAMPAVLVPWGLLWHRRKAVWPSLSLALGWPLFFLGWPRMWTNTSAHFREFLGYLHTHGSIFVYYLGKLYGGGTTAPWHYPLVMTLATLPATTVIAVVAGVAYLARRIRSVSIGALILGQAAFMLALASQPGLPKFDGVRLFLPAFPFLACAAGIWLDRAHQWLSLRVGSPRAASLPFLAHFAGLLAVTVWIHPFYLSYYGGLVGGVRGAHRMGFESTYWGDAIDLPLLEFINANAPPGARITMSPYGSLARDYLRMVRALRPDLALVEPTANDWDWVALSCRQGFFGEGEWGLYGRESEALFANRRAGVPLAMVFQRPAGWQVPLATRSRASDTLGPRPASP